MFTHARCINPSGGACLRDEARDAMGVLSLRDILDDVGLPLVSHLAPVAMVRASWFSHATYTSLVKFSHATHTSLVKFSAL